MDTPKYYNRWDVEGVVVGDEGLKRYITLAPRIVPKTGNRYTHTRFHKSNMTIVERLINKVMVPGHKAKKHFRGSGDKCGKATTAAKIVYDALSIIEDKTKKNPIAVLVQAIVNAAPREEIVATEYGGARYPKAVECTPQRRVDLTLRYLTQGAFSKSFDSRKSVSTTLADEIMAAARSESTCMAIAKKVELERQADSSR